MSSVIIGGLVEDTGLVVGPGLAIHEELVVSAPAFVAIGAAEDGGHSKQPLKAVLTVIPQCICFFLAMVWEGRVQQNVFN